MGYMVGIESSFARLVPAANKLKFGVMAAVILLAGHATAKGEDVDPTTGTLRHHAGRKWQCCGLRSGKDYAVLLFHPIRRFADSDRVLPNRALWLFSVYLSGRQGSRGARQPHARRVAD